MASTRGSVMDRIAKSKNLTIVCCATPNYGHMFPMSRVAIAAKEKGHTVHVVTMKCAKAGGVPRIFEGSGVELHLTENAQNLEYDEEILKGFV